MRSASFAGRTLSDLSSRPLRSVVPPGARRRPRTFRFIAVGLFVRLFLISSSGRLCLNSRFGYSGRAASCQFRVCDVVMRRVRTFFAGFLTSVAGSCTL